MFTVNKRQHSQASWQPGAAAEVGYVKGYNTLINIPQIPAIFIKSKL